MKEPSFWTDERTEELKLRWAKGESGSQICLAMHARSRNAVVGKAYRLKLEPRATAHDQTAKRSNGKRRRQYNTLHYADGHVFIVKGEQGMIEEKPPVFENPVTFFELRENHCRWPGSGEMPDLLFCGAPALNGYSYCASHCQLAYCGRSYVKAARL
jgi:hypothetical protein